MKIKKIEVKSLKAISDQVADFSGRSAIITAGNNKGKSTLLRGLIDRFRGEKPEVILKEGEKNGFSILELTDGCKIEWKFTEKTESFSYTTPDGIKMTKGVLSAIGEKYFGIKFDVDKFLNSGPKVQSKTLGALVGIDFTEVDSRFKIEYGLRTDANKEVARLRAIKHTEPVKIEKPTSLELLNKELSESITFNKDSKQKWNDKNKIHQQKIIDFNADQYTIKEAFDNLDDSYVWLLKYTTSAWSECINFDKAKEILDNAERPKEIKPLTSLNDPIQKDTLIIHEKIEKLNKELREYDAYERDLSTYNAWIKEGRTAKELADAADKKVKGIEAEKLQMISKANIPEEFKFTEDGITYNGFPLSNAQLSSSSKYIAALKLGLMSLGSVKTMHFDASFLDNISLAEIQEWADKNELQLLIERPDLDGGEIKYEII